MEQYYFLVFFAVGFAGVVFGSWSTNSLWKSKARCVTRKEHQGRLYWVIEDGDEKKLAHVVKCFEPK